MAHVRLTRSVVYYIDRGGPDRLGLERYEIPLYSEIPAPELPLVIASVSGVSAETGAYALVLNQSGAVVVTPAGHTIWLSDQFFEYLN